MLKLLFLSTPPELPEYKNCLLCDKDVEKLTGFFPPNHGSENDKL